MPSDGLINFWLTFSGQMAHGVSLTVYMVLTINTFRWGKLTAVDSLDANVISKFPLRPSSAGTKMKTSVTFLNTSQCCKRKKKELSDTLFICTLILDFPASRTVRINVCCLNHPQLETLLGM